MTTVLTVILNWRTPEMSLRAAEAALTALEGIEGGLVIVDNDSGDGSFERMASEVSRRGWDKGPQRVRVLQSGHNGGYGAGNNFGMRALLPDGRKPEFIYILNSDAFPEPDAVRALIAHLESYAHSGIAGSLIVGEDGLEHRTAFRFPSIAAEFESQVRFGPISRWLQDSIVAQPVPQQTTRVDWVSGASFLVRQVMLDQIGLFDEMYFLYFEETDLCHRAALAGWQVDFVRESKVVHIGAASTGRTDGRRTPGYWLDSRLRYFSKNHGPLYAATATLSHMFGASIWRVRLLFQRKHRGDPPLYLWDLTRHAVLAGWRALLHRGQPGPKGIKTE